ncbi:hypothetical protein ACFS07_01250 [Undibacterium arcticum]
MIGSQRMTMIQIIPPQQQRIVRLQFGPGAEFLSLPVQRFQ